MKKNKVAYHIRSVYDIPNAFFIEKKTKTLVVDLDNTLDSAYALKPREDAYLLKKRLTTLGIRMIVLSNNKEKRVKPYCQLLGVSYLADARKFSKNKIKRYLEQEKVDLKTTLFVGDQLFTDRIYVNKLQGELILTEPLVKKDQFFTRFIRWFDNYVRKKWLKQNRLGKNIQQGGNQDVL